MRRVQSGRIAGALLTLAALVSPHPGGSHAEAAPAAKAVPHDGPFGIAMGEPLADLGPVEKAPSNGYKVLKPPRPNDAFRLIIVQAFRTTGVCEIFASQYFEDDPNAQKAIQATDSLADSLKEKYGPYTKVDTCSGDDASCRDLFTAELNEQAAKYGYGWDFTGKVRDDKIWRVALAVTALNGTTSIMGLAYWSANQEACDAAERAANASSL